MTPADRAAVHAARVAQAREANLRRKVNAMKRGSRRRGAPHADLTDDEFTAVVLDGIRALEAAGEYPSVDRIEREIGNKSTRRIYAARCHLIKTGQWSPPRRPQTTVRSLTERDDAVIQAAISELSERKAQVEQILAMRAAMDGPYDCRVYKAPLFDGGRTRRRVM